MVFSHALKKKDISNQALYNVERCQYTPLKTASCNAVERFKWGFNSAPAFNNRLTHSMLPLLAASHNGVEPSMFLALI